MFFVLGMGGLPLPCQDILLSHLPTQLRLAQPTPGKKKLN